jgi:2-methylaconitate cis-trans-isomerase PrpF
LIPGTTVCDVVRPDHNCGTVRIGHPSGITDVKGVVEGDAV